MDKPFNPVRKITSRRLDLIDKAMVLDQASRAPPLLPDERTEADLNEAPAAYHAHPSNPSTCELFREHFKRPCPCEMLMW